MIIPSTLPQVGVRVDRVGPDSNLVATSLVRETGYGSIKEAYDAFRESSYGRRPAVGIVQVGDEYYGYRLASDHKTLPEWWNDEFGPSRHRLHLTGSDALGVRGYRFEADSPLKAIIDGTVLVLPDGTNYGVAAPAPRR